MSTSSLSRTVSASGRQLNLADILAHIAQDESLPNHQRQDMASALRAIGNAIGLPLEQVRAHPSYIRERLRDFTPAVP